MKKSFFFLASALALTFTFVSCNKNNGEEEIEQGFEVIDDSELSNNEIYYKNAVIPYVSNTVFPTYEGMATNAIRLAEKVSEILAAAEQGDKDNTELVAQAGEYWTASRKYWEQSEAFLYGPAADYNIDPHIDSWPFDQAAFDDLINDAARMEEYRQKLLSGASLVEDEYGLMGYHALEYVLFALSEDGQTSSAHKVGDFSVAQWTYMAVVANDLRNQSILLEASWKGVKRVSSDKQQYLAAANMTSKQYTYLENGYAAKMLRPGYGDVVYANYQAAVEEIIAGAIDIADEVANSKIGAAANAIPGSDSYQEDHDNIESPYSLHSIIDFQDNIVSIQHALLGSNEDDASVADFLNQVDKKIVEEIENTAEASIEAIGKIQEPFVEHAKDQAAQDAISAIHELMDALQKAYEAVAGVAYEPEEEE